MIVGIQEQFMAQGRRDREDSTEGLNSSQGRSDQKARVVGGRLRQLRETRGLTQEDLAIRTGYSDRLIRKAERSGVLRIRTIEAICIALSDDERTVTVSELTGHPLQLIEDFMNRCLLNNAELLEHVEQYVCEDFQLNCLTEIAGLPGAGTWNGFEGLREWVGAFSVFQAALPETEDSWDHLYAGDRGVSRTHLVINNEVSQPTKVRITVHWTITHGQLQRLEIEVDTFALKMLLN